ncbi:hypothetical protein EJ05DRAFT_496482 [Pseudovirgaria hyperparasitica]|uniref:Kazal-like domain-containing protein n=1 Tax=Pseudovirgaria hyperparasitica TaxID=470096 RepID=A0A6A6WHK8_9PEZI|nr:uncharacterized protein EJ05DRAFT_496482 [Pseudovirgaria hyperparasitica]KAF2761575.1 hypothetical protein EJ05DRAFT_496482 [Pseudovirgaria hyperparasitica]
MKYTLLASALFALATAVPSNFARDSTCDCGPAPICIQSWPESCYCQNDYLRKCYEMCGGAQPTYGDCSAVAKKRQETLPFSCANVRCREGFVCVGAGICVLDTPCGGFAGTPCADKQTCVDDPRDDCDPQMGGSDCIGLCLPYQG